MKNKGAIFEYEEERNRDLMSAFRAARSANMSLTLPEIYKIVVDMPSVRFWVSEERAAIVVSSMMRGNKLEKMRPTKREMYREIYYRVKKLRKLHPDLSTYDLVFIAVNSPAPKFYLTPGSAKVIFHKIKHQWYMERKRKYRHLFM